MVWDVEYTDQFESWWNSLTEAEQEEVAAVVGLLEQFGPSLPYPRSSHILSSRHREMRELRIQIKGAPYRVLYAFDPKRTAILLLGGNKKGNDRWYDKVIPLADKLFDEHLKEIEGGD